MPTYKFCFKRAFQTLLMDDRNQYYAELPQRHSRVNRRGRTRRTRDAGEDEFDDLDREYHNLQDQRVDPAGTIDEYLYHQEQPQEVQQVNGGRHPAVDNAGNESDNLDNDRNIETNGVIDDYATDNEDGK
jgi:hypothetical protein